MGLFDGVTSGVSGSSSFGSGGTSTGGGFMGLSNRDWLGAGMQLLGGFMNDRNSRRDSRAQQQMNREQIAASRQNTRDQLAANMQGDQDAYARTIMRNRGAIAPWRERYSGPSFTTANPNAPIYNPLMEPGHMFSELRTPVTPVQDPKKPPRKGKK